MFQYRCQRWYSDLVRDAPHPVDVAVKTSRDKSMADVSRQSGGRRGESGRYALVSTVNSATGRLFLSARLIYRHSCLRYGIMDLCRPLRNISLQPYRIPCTLLLLSPQFRLRHRLVSVASLFAFALFRSARIARDPELLGSPRPLGYICVSRNI